jgi:hypothetical protein
MVRILILGVIIFSVLAYILFIIYKSGFRWGLKSPDLEKEREKLLKGMTALREQLIPFDVDEIELISNNFKNIQNAGSFSYTNSGLIYSVFKEPMLAYSYKMYAPLSTLAVVCSDKNTFTYIIRKSFTKVYIDHTEIGVITPEGLLYSPNQKLLANIDRNPLRPKQSVYVYGREVGEMAIPGLSGIDRNSDKAFVMLDRLEQDEYELFLALTLYKLLPEVLKVKTFVQFFSLYAYNR